MSNTRYRSQFSYSYAGQKVELMAKVSIGASGAPTIQSGTGMGIQSIVRSSAGRYVITMTQAFAALLDLKLISISGSSAPAAPILGIVSDAVSTSAAPAVTIQMRDLAGAAADPASGEILLITIKMDRSSLGH